MNATYWQADDTFLWMLNKIAIRRDTDKGREKDRLRKIKKKTVIAHSGKKKCWYCLAWIQHSYHTNLSTSAEVMLRAPILLWIWSTHLSLIHKPQTTGLQMQRHGITHHHRGTSTLCKIQMTLEHHKHIGHVDFAFQVSVFAPCDKIHCQCSSIWPGLRRHTYLGPVIVYCWLRIPISPKWWLLFLGSTQKTNIILLHINK